MKKWILVLGMITCLLGLTACDTGKEVTENYGVTEEQALEYGKLTIESINRAVLEGMAEDYKSNPVLYAGMQDYETAMEDMGEYQSIIGHTVSYDDGVTIDLEISGSRRDATMEIILDEELNYVSISTSVVYSFGEIMAKAALNTVMGMGTVFAVLILIIFLISGFSLISRVQNRGNQAEKKNKEAAVTQPVREEEEQEELSDDLELVAVIAAAVAAYEGAASSDGYVVRSIKRRKR